MGLGVAGGESLGGVDVGGLQKGHGAVRYVIAGLRVADSLNETLSTT